MVVSNKHFSKKLVIFLSIVAVIVLFGAFRLHQRGTLAADRTVFRGTVENIGPFSQDLVLDTPTIYLISGRRVGIGGGLQAPSKPGGVLDHGAGIGARVEVRAKIDHVGDKEYLTIFDCPDCYIKTL